MSRNNDYATGNLSDYEYIWRHYKLISIDLSKKIELDIIISNSKLTLMEYLMNIMQQYSLSLKNQKKQDFNFHSFFI